MENIINKTFGRLFVIKYIGAKYPNKRTKGHQWLCRCKCGKEKTVLGGDLKSGNTTSCGCYQKDVVHNRTIDMTGLAFGNLLVIKFSHTKHGQTYWLCKCNCGNEKVIAGPSLRFGRTKSCGCKQGNLKHGLSKNKKEYRKYRFENPLIKLQHNVGCAVRDAIKFRNGKKSGRTFNHLPYSVEDLKKYLENQFEPWMNWDNYGGKNNCKRKTWHIDHIIPQSQFPYKSMDDQLFQECWRLDNLRPLEKISNIRKNNRQII